MAYVIGIDSSTTATKAIVVDERGLVVAVGVSTYSFESPQSRWAEQDAELWWEASIAAVSSALQGLDTSRVVAIGLTGQMHGSVLLDGAGDVLAPAILWNDQRTDAECDAIRDLIGVERLLAITGNDAMTGFTAPKLLWTRRHKPEVWREIRHVLLPKDYIRLRLTGEFATDVADGSGTLLFDLVKRTWSPVVLDVLEIDPSWMPGTYEGPEVTGTVSESAAAATGLPVGIPVVAGGGDQAANAIGVGVVSPGSVALSLGTSGVVFAPTDGPLVHREGRVHSFCHAVPGQWHMMSVMLSAAGSLRWLRDVAAPRSAFNELTAAAGDVAPGSDGLLFLPYLSGERSPYPDPLARGAFVGLTVRHRIGHLARAVMEGVAFGLRDGLDLMLGAGMAAPATVLASGGGTRSPVWNQILADVLNAEVSVVDTAEGAGFGAALLAAVGVGWFETVSEASSLITATPVAEPGSAHSFYAELHATYRELYPILTPTFRALSVVEEPP